jgi:hypothetical protein
MTSGEPSITSDLVRHVAQARDDPRFETHQVDAAIQHVIVNGAHNNGATTYYPLVFGAADMPAPQYLHQDGDSHLVTAFMEAFHRRCEERGLPPLDSPVVHVAGPRQGQPGGGSFRINNQPDPFSDSTSPERATAAARFWQNQQQACRDWGTRPRRGQI